jgi:uncharacterized protein YbcI
VTIPPDPAAERLTGGQLHAAISNAVVHIQREYLGRGPTKARTSVLDDMVVVMLEDTLTKVESSLVDAGDHDEVRRVRQRFQRAMRDDLVAAVEALTGRSVLAFLSDNHIEPDLGCEIFVLEPAPGAEPLDTSDAREESGRSV